MPSISKLSVVSQFTSFGVATTTVADDPNHNKTEFNALKKAFNDANGFVSDFIRMNLVFIDLVTTRLESVLEKLEKQQQELDDQVFDHSVIFQELKDTIRDDFVDFNNRYLLAKENATVSTQGIRKGIYLSVADSYHHYINDCHKDELNEMIAMHFYRLGLFDAADLFVKEAGVEELTDKVTSLGLRLQFKKMQDVINSVKNFETEFPLQWIVDNREMLGETKASELEYKIHVNKYLRMVEEPGARINAEQEALNYAKAHLASFYNEHYANEIQMLCGCVFFESHLLRLVGNSRYLHLFDGSYQQTLIAEVEKQFYIMMEQCVTDPLSTVTSVGAKYLAGVCAAAKIVVDENGCGWAEFGNLPLFLNLDEDLKFHSRFACPILKYAMETAFNPPVALECKCNHVVSFLVMHSNSINETIICPICHDLIENLGYKTIYF